MPDELKDWDLSQPQRQSLLGVVVYILRNMRALAALAFSFFAFGAINTSIWLVFALVALPIVIIFLVFAYYQYSNFTFQVNGEELIIHKGVFVKDRLVVEVDRIQSIQITENLIQRILGVVALRVDTAGSKGSELEIPALERPKAEKLKSLLYQKKDAILEDARVEQEGVVQNKNGEPSDPTEETGEVLVHLTILDLIKVGITENHLRTGFIALAFVFGTFSQYWEYLQDYFSDSVDTYTEQALNAGFAALTFFVIAFAVFSVLISVVRTFLRFYDLKATLKSEAVEVNTGLLKRNESRVPIRKIQFIQWEGNPLRKAVGYESAKIKQSNSMGETEREQKIEIPALKSDETQKLIQGVFEGFSEPEVSIDASSWAYARFNFIIGFLILIPAAVFLYFQVGWVAASVFLIAPIIAIFGYFYGQTVRIQYSKNYMVIRKGLFFTRRIVIPSYKIQALSVDGNLFIDRRHLRHVSFYTAAGTRSIRYLHEREAYLLRDYLLYCAESSEVSWM